MDEHPTDRIRDNLFDQRETQDGPDARVPVAEPNRIVLALSLAVGYFVAAAIWGGVVFLTLDLVGGIDLSLRELAGSDLLLTALILGVRNTVQSLFRA